MFHHTSTHGNQSGIMTQHSYVALCGACMCMLVRVCMYICVYVFTCVYVCMCINGHAAVRYHMPCPMLTHILQLPIKMWLVYVYILAVAT